MAFGDWSPDGRRIVATAGDQGLVILKPDGTGVTPLGATGECARWSPDGTRIAYCHLEDNPSGTPQWEVYVVNADGSNQTRLTHRPAYDYPSGWSPDGRQLVVWAQLGAPERLALLDPDTGEEQPLTGLASSHEVLGAWLTDGRFLVGIESPADGLHGWYLLDRSDPAHPRFTPVLPALQTICCGEGQLAWMPSPR
jgi:Tol biopolymer transport system component